MQIMHRRNHFPQQLSGGQQQRVALARAIVFKPRLLLMDEPLGALDKQLRESLQLEMRRLHADLGITFIYVTHDQEEALTMSDRIAVMNEGRIEQLGSPAEVYGSPRSLHVLEFVGQSTRLAGTVEAPAAGGIVAVATPLGAIRAPVRDLGRMTGKVVIGVRPESIGVGAQGAPAADINEVRARLTDIVFFGAKTTLHFKAPAAADRLQAEVARLRAGLEAGAEVTLRWPVAETMVYPAP
jgi:putative spermidine/putrescine transport system ATP-binding protein